MGTTSITINTRKEKYEAINAKDAKTTLIRLGFRVTGLIVKDKFGNVVEKQIK